MEIDGNDVILSLSPKPGMTVMVALHIESITDATLIAKRQDESGQRYRASFVLTRI